MKQSKHVRTAIVVCSFVFVAALVAFILVKVFEPHETHTSDANTTTTIAVLDCKSSSPADAFFHSATAKSETHEVKITAKNDVADKISFTYTGDFADAEAVKNAASALHADYNIYMGKTAIEASALSPNFSTIDNQMVATLFLSDSTLTADTGKLVFLSSSDVQNLKKLSLASLSKIYNSKGFSCEILDSK